MVTLIVSMAVSALQNLAQLEVVKIEDAEHFRSRQHSPRSATGDTDLRRSMIAYSYNHPLSSANSD